MRNRIALLDAPHGTPKATGRRYMPSGQANRFNTDIHQRRWWRQGGSSPAVMRRAAQYAGQDNGDERARVRLFLDASIESEIQTGHPMLLLRCVLCMLLLECAAIAQCLADSIVMDNGDRLTGTSLASKAASWCWLRTMQARSKSISARSAASHPIK
jgi:hypothetical protein